MDAIKPLDDQEQQALIRLFQAFMQLPNASQLRLSFYADTGGALYQMGKTISDEKILFNWLDMEDGAASMDAYAQEAQEEQREEGNDARTD